MGDFVIQAQIIENILEEYSIHSDKYKPLITLLQQTDFYPLDLILLEEYAEPFEDFIGEIIDMTSNDILDSIGTKKFADELNRIKTKVHHGDDKKVFDKLINFLENESETIYDTKLTAGLANIVINLPEYNDKMICVYAIRKIESLFIEE